MTIRLAIIGAGIMGSDHARIFCEDIPGAEVRVICDASPDRADALATAVGAKVMTDPRAAIQRSDIDAVVIGKAPDFFAVVIASPDFTHAPLSLACIEARKPVLCEKPLSQSSAECHRVIEAEMASGRRWVQLGFMRRYDRAYAQMKSALTQGRIGRALMMHNFHRNVETPAADFTGAMAITNSAPHEFDVVRFVLDTEYAAVTAFQPKRSDALVAPVVMMLETVDGRSDLYSLGVVLYEMASGKPPFSADSPVAIAYKHVQEPIPSLSEQVPGIPRDYEAITLRALSKDPDDRYADGAAMRADLLRFREGKRIARVHVVHSGPARPPSPPSPTC